MKMVENIAITLMDKIDTADGESKYFIFGFPGEEDVDTCNVKEETAGAFMKFVEVDNEDCKIYASKHLIVPNGLESICITSILEILFNGSCEYKSEKFNPKEIENGDKINFKLSLSN